MNTVIIKLATWLAAVASATLLLGAAWTDDSAAEGAGIGMASASPLNALPCPAGQPIGLLGYARSVGNRAIGIDVQGDYAYVGDWHRGFWPYAGVLQVFDVSNPCTPVRGYYDIYSQEIGDVAAHGDRLYVANDAAGLRVYDIGTDPANPGPPAWVFGGRPGFDHWVFYEGGDHLYVGGWSSFVQAFDLPPAPPVPPGTGITRVPDYGVADMFVTANRAYLFTDPKLYIADVNDLHDGSVLPYDVLPIIAYFELTDYGSGGEVRVQDGYAYLAMGESGTSLGGLRIVDVNETAPALVSTFDLPGGAGNIFAKGIGLAVSDDRAYLAARGGLWGFDISLPESPLHVSTFPLPADFANAMGAHVEIRGNLAFMTAYNNAGAGGLAIYKLYHPVEIDIKPGTSPNCINLNGKGVIPVAIFGSPEIDVTYINDESLMLAGMDVARRGKKGPLCSVKDVNTDSYPDLVCHFEDQPENWLGGFEMAMLRGETLGGEPVKGSDSVCIVP